MKPRTVHRWARLAASYTCSSAAARRKLAKRVKIPVSDLDQLLLMPALQRNRGASKTHAARLG